MLRLFGTIFCLRCVFLFDLITTLTQFRRSDSFHSYVINKISNSLSFITKFITFVGKNDIMLGRASHNIMFANSCNKFSNKRQLIRDSIYIHVY